MIDSLTNFDQPVAKRPVFLTVLCILTFIGSTLGLFSGVIGYFSAEKSAAAMQVFKGVGPSSYDSDATKITNKMLGGIGELYTVSNLKTNAIAGVVAAVLCLFGAILMWQLKKNGFYSYLAGTFVGIATPIYVFGVSNILILGSAIFVALFGIAFCIMYGLNLKHMK